MWNGKHTNDCHKTAYGYGTIEILAIINIIITFRTFATQLWKQYVIVYNLAFITLLHWMVCGFPQVTCAPFHFGRNTIHRQHKKKCQIIVLNVIIS